MFKTKKTMEDETETVEEVKTAAKPAPSPAPRPAAAKKENTVIGENISIEGVLRGKENLLFEGKMKGSIELDNYKLTVGTKGQVEADIKAEHVTISGQLVGNITATGKVEITSQANFTGEIVANRISVEDGASLNAKIEMQAGSKKAMPSKEEKPSVQLVSSGPKEVKKPEGTPEAPKSAMVGEQGAK